MPTVEKSSKRYETVWWDSYMNCYYIFDKNGNKSWVDFGGINPFAAVKELVRRGRHFILGRDGPGPSLRKILEENGNSRIVRGYVCRAPIFSNLEHLAGLVSNGDYDKAKEDLYYDKMFHLFMNLELENGRYIKIEKNEEIEAQVTGTFDRSQLDGEGAKCKEVVGFKNNSLTLTDLINRGEELQGKHEFWSYDPVTDNCQVFCKIILQASNILTKDLESFIMQNVAQIFKSLPKWTQKVVQVLPKFKQRLNILFRGVGKGMTCQECHEIMGGNLSKLKCI